MNPSLPPPLVCFRIHTQRHAQLKSFATKFPKVTRFCRPDVLRNYGVVWLNVMVRALRCQLEKSHISTHLQIKRKGSGSQNVLQVLGQWRKLAFKWRKWVIDSAWCPEWKTTSQTQARLLKRFDSDDLAEKVEKCWVKIDLVSVSGVGSTLACSWTRDKVSVVLPRK